MRAEPLEQQPAGWWSHSDYCRQVTFIQDRIHVTEASIGLNDTMLHGYKERCEILEPSVAEMRGGKLQGDNVTATTGITNITPVDTVSTVQSLITTASGKWLDHITKVCQQHTQDLLEQKREHDKSQQKMEAHIMENNTVLVAVVESTLDQVGRCTVEIQSFTTNTMEAQRTA